ncbi:ABC transporter ATP-binding protein [Urechidicola sp. KH5]
MLEVQNISYSYEASKQTLFDISFKANRGDYIALVGESGCGKSTLLEIIYGLIHVEKGEVFWDKTKLLGPNFYLIPGEHFMKYLPQDFNLMPYITVEENVGKHLSYRDPKRQSRIDELLEVVDMTAFKKTKVKNLSYGQKQRIAIAKVLAKLPEVVLLDEPFSNIDNFRKNKLRRNLFNYLKSKNILTFVATHDATDALSFADQILVMKDGEIVTQDTPNNLFSDPPNAYSAALFDEVNKVPSQLLDSNSKEELLFYPHQIKVNEKAKNKATVVQSYFKGTHYLIEATFNSMTIYFNHHKSLEKDVVVDIEFIAPL